MIDYERLIKCLRTDAFLIELTTKNIAQDCRMAANAIEELTGKKVAYNPPFNWCGEEPIASDPIQIKGFDMSKGVLDMQTGTFYPAEKDGEI